MTKAARLPSAGGWSPVCHRVFRKTGEGCELVIAERAHDRASLGGVPPQPPGVTVAVRVGVGVSEPAIW